MTEHWSYKPDRIRIEDRGFDTPCHIWLLAKDRDGYGMVKVGSRTDGTRRQERAHRHAWVQRHGPIPADKLLNHRCQQRDCANTEHMELVTTVGNLRRDHAGATPKAIVERVRTMRGTNRAIAQATNLNYETVRRIRRGDRWNVELSEV